MYIPYLIPFICFLISFLVVFFLTKWFINYFNSIGLVVKDMNKEGTPLIPLSGGLPVMAGLFMGLMSFIFIRTYFPVEESVINGNGLTSLFAASTTILIIGIIGFIDDLIIKKDKETSAGLKQWQKPFLTLFAAIPLVVINSGFELVNFPIIGTINFGFFYALIFIPIGVIGASNMVNMLAGFNGMETGMGIIYIGMLGLYAFVNERYVAALIALITVGALLAFYLYNKYPAKILPGDSLTYLLGAVLATIAIVGNIERAALVASIPFFVEFFLKLRGKFKKQSYGYGKDEKLYSNYSKIYSIPHIFTRTGKFTEKQVVFFMILIELFFSSLIWFIPTRFV